MIDDFNAGKWSGACRQNDFIRRYGELAELSAETVAELIGLKDALARCRPADAQLTQWIKQIYADGHFSAEALPSEAEFNAVFGSDLSGIAGFLLVISGFPGMEKRFAELNWPPEILSGLFRDLGTWVRHHQRNYGSPGLAYLVLAWFKEHINLNLVSFGRLQFNVSADFYAPAFVFRHRRNREIAVLAADGRRFGANGLLDDYADSPSAGAWTSCFGEDARCRYGNPITPDGLAQREIHTLLRSDWQLVLSWGDPVINIHIPEIGPLDPAACRQSLAAAEAFFSHYRPDYFRKAFACASWLLDPQLAGLLPENSNIAAFRRLGHLVPFPGEADTVFRCFGVKGIGNDSTGFSRLQRGLADFVRRGGRFHYGAMVILPDEIRAARPC